MTQNENLLDLKSFFGSAAFYRKPNGEVLIWQGPFKKSAEGKGHLASMMFFDSQLEWWQGQPISLPVPQFRQHLQACVAAEGDTQISRQDFSQPDQQEFQKTFQDIQLKIHRGEIDKAVPCVFVQAPKSPSKRDLAHWIHCLLELPESLHVFGFWQQGQGLVGATPEILFHQKDSAITGMALAGTCPKKEMEQRLPLLRDPKEMREHSLVVKDIEQRLSHWGRVRTEATELLELPTIFHLRTLIHLEVSGVSPSQLVKQLHPTPALGVSPRNYGLQWLKKYSGQEKRGYFGAPLLFQIDENECVALVVIRSLMWTPENTVIGTGCGVVAESDFEREWKELSAKREAIFKSIGL